MQGTQLTSEPNIGGNVNTNAAASQSSGRRGILLSVLLLLLLMPFHLEQTQFPHAFMKMRLTQSRRNLDVWKTETVRTPRPFCFDDPKRQLRQSFFCVREVEGGEIKGHHAFSLGCELLRHWRLAARNCSPIDMTLRFTGNVRAYAS